MKGHYLKKHTKNSLSHLLNSFSRLEEVLYTPFIIHILSIIKVPREIRLTQPEITDCGVIFFSTKHLAGQVQVCAQVRLEYVNI